MLEEGTRQPEVEPVDFAQRAATNTAFLLGATIVSRLVGLLAVGYVARSFDAEGLGAYNLTLSLTAVFGLLADFGISIYVGREVAARPAAERELLRHGAVASLFAGATAFALCNAVATLSGYDEELRQWILISSTALLLGPAVLPMALLQARLRGGRVATIILATQSLSFAATVVVVATRQDIQTYIVLQALVNLAYAGLIVWMSRAARHYRERFGRREVAAALRLLGRAAPLGSIALFALLDRRFDTFLLSIISGERSVGYYSSAWKLSELLHFVPTAVAASATPIVASQIARRPELIARGLRRAFRYLALLALPILIGALVLAKPIMLFVYGGAFGPAASAYRVLMLAEAFYFFGFVAAGTLVGMRAVQQLVVVQLLTLPANAIACILLLPRYDYLGAAWITLATELVNTAYMTMVVARRLEIGPKLLPLGAAARALVACGPMVGALALLSGKAVMVQILAGAFVYGVALVAVRGLGAEDLEVVKGLVGRRR
jgi:O-antigen/teichoic acid export membrane protein